MTGGLLQLVSYGIEDDILIANPEITFFKTVYRRYTNFSIDTINSLHDIKFGSTINIQIPKSGDLLYKTVIKLELPTVIAKYKHINNNLIDNEYFYNEYTINTNMIFNQLNIINKIMTDFYLYVDDNNIRKLYDIFNTSNLMYYNLNQNNNKLIINSINYNKYLHNLIPVESDGYNIYNNNNNNIISNYYFYLLFNHKYESYLLETSYNYLNTVKDELYNTIMVNSFLRQYYMINYDYNNINNIMLNVKVKGNIKSYTNNEPKYLIYVDKDDPFILVPVIINNINKIDNIYSFIGYIVDIDYYKKILKYDFNGLNRYLKFENIIIKDNIYRQVDITLKIINIENNKIIIEGNEKIYNFIKKLKYALFICNSTHRLDEKKYFDNKINILPPIAIILIKNIKFVYFIEIEYEYSNRSYNINNLKLLNHYIPLSISTFSTDTDYKIQIDYLINNNLKTDMALNTTTLYIDIIFKILNQMYNTTPLTIKNTINNDLSINMNMLFNNIQLENYKEYLQINEIRINTLFEKINKNFNNYCNNLINSYQYISLSNKNCLKQIINIYKIVNSYKNTLSYDDIIFKKSLDTNSIFSIILDNNIFNDIYEYDNIELKKISNNILYVGEIYKIRLYSYNLTNFSSEYYEFIKSNNLLYYTEEINYNDDIYIIKYIYNFIYIIEINNEYIDIYVKIDIKLKKNNIDLEYTNQHFIDQIISFIPNNDNIYILQDDNNLNILFKLKKDNNYKCYIQNYIISKQIINPIENILFLKKYYNIRDIISFPKYYHSKFNYDQFYQQNPINNITNNISNIFIHDIYILILYDIYRDLIDNNTNISNIISLIIQDVGYTFNSLFKDPYIKFNNYKKYNINQKSLEEEAIIENNYNNYQNNNINIFNILSNNSIYSINKLINISNDIIERLDKYFINQLNNQNDFKNIINSIITDQYYQNIIINLLNNKLTYNNIIKVLNNSKDTIKLLTLSTANNIINNIIINKDELKLILDNFSLITKESFDISELYDINIYNLIFKIINDGIKKYFELYFKNSVLINTYISKFNKATIDNLILLFSDKIINYTDKYQIILSLNNLNTNKLISNEIFEDINYNILNNIDKIIVFNDKKSLSYYAGCNLLNNIKNIVISDINYNITIDDIVNSEKIKNIIKLPLNIHNIELELIKLTKESLISIEQYDNIINKLEIYDLNKYKNKIIDENIKLIYIKDNKLEIKNILIVNSVKTTSDLINDNYNDFDFINFLINSKITIEYPDLIEYIINNSANLTNTQKKGIINLCNNNAIDELYEIKNKLKNDQIKINKIVDPLYYDKLIYISDLNYYECIFYLYNYIITQLYKDDNITINLDNGISIKYNNYEIRLNNCFTIDDNYNIDYNIDDLKYNINKLIKYLDYNISIETNISILLKEYTNKDYKDIYDLLNIIKNYTLNNTDDIIKIIIYDNFDILTYILIHLTNCYNLRDLINDKYSNINNNIIKISNLSTINDIILYTKGNIIYNYNLSIFYNFGKMIDEQKDAYVNFYNNLLDMNDIGINSLYYVDLYKSSNIDKNNIDYFYKYSLDKIGISNNVYKTNFTYINLTSDYNLYLFFKKILIEIKENIINYDNNKICLDYINNNFNLNKYYSNINLFYSNEILSNETIPDNVKTIFIKYLEDYKQKDIINFMNIKINDNIKLNYKIKNSFIRLGLKQIIELYNRNKLNYISDNYIKHYNLIIDDYVGKFYTTQINNLNNSNIKFNNTKVSEKITDAIISFKKLNINEKTIIKKLYNDLPEINRLILKNEINYNVNGTLYKIKDIIMTIDEFNKIDEKKYDYINGSIAIYNGKYYRKTDLPFEYIYIFNNTEIDKIDLRYKIDNNFLNLYYQLSIFMDDLYNENSDEQNLILKETDYTINNLNIIIEGKLLSESHKLMNINNKLIEIKKVINYTKILEIDYSYYLLFSDTIESIINKINIRKEKKEILNNYNGTFYIYFEDKIYQYDKAFIDYDNDFLIFSFIINGNLYNITDLIIRSKNNNIELEFSDYIKINKYYSKINSVDIYIKNFNKLYISDKYYIKNDKLVINANIINIFNYKSEIELNEIINKSEIKLGLNNLLDLIDTSLFDTYKLLENVNIDFNFNEYSNDYYKKFNKIMTTDELINSIIGDNIKKNKLEEQLIINNYKLNEKNNFYKLVNTNINLPKEPSFSYIPYMCDFIFNKIKLNIDGNLIDELKDGYQHIYHNFINDREKQISYYRMNSNNEKLLIESNKKENVVLYIELPLYFNQIPGLALPLISNVYSQIEFNFLIRNLEDMIIKNEFVELEYKNKLKMTLIYSIIYLEEKERNMFSTMRQEYLIEKKIYNTSIQLDITKQYQDKFYLGIEYPIKDIFYYIQLKNNVLAKQYYNFTYNYLLPELDITTINKLIYLQQIMNLGYYDYKIKKLYDKCIVLMLEKIIKYKLYNISLTNLKLLYNNLTTIEQTLIESYFNEYYENCLTEETLEYSILYLNSVERYKIDDYYSNKIVAYQNYNKIIPGLHSYSFSLYPLEYQPSGYVNLSTLKPEFRLILSSIINKLNSKDILNTYMIGRSYNILRFISGIIGIAWQ